MVSLFYFLIIIICLWLLVSVIKIRKEDLSIELNSADKKYRDFQLYLLNNCHKAEIPRFKFYSNIVGELLKLKKQYGADISEAKRELKKASQFDFNEEKQISNELYGFYFQYVFISVFTWIFAINFQGTLEIELPFFVIVSLLCFQIIGLFLSWKVLREIRLKTFSIFSSYFQSLYILKSLLLASRPLSEALELGRFGVLEPSSKLSFIQNTIEQIMMNIKKRGEFHQDDIDGVLMDLWSLYRNEVQQFKKRLIGVKLFFISFFIFPGFLWSLYMSLEQVMIWP